MSQKTVFFILTTVRNLNLTTRSLTHHSNHKGTAFSFQIIKSAAITKENALPIPMAGARGAQNVPIPNNFSTF
jgi:hypothetical protein